uniref:Guanylate cyclase n=1 Tax=Strigamia maritima TaxID=126957 RepID=T1ISY6_STRMM
MTVNHMETFPKVTTCCEKRMKCCDKQPFGSIVDNTYQFTRIYIFIGDFEDLTFLMTTLRLKRLLDKGEYMVIYIEEPYSETKMSDYLLQGTNFSKMIDQRLSDSEDLLASRSLFIVATTPTENYKEYTNFEDQVRLYNNMEPFNFKDPLPLNIQKHITIFAAHLYDAIFMYATALNDTLAKGGNETDGEEIIKLIINKKNHPSIRGVQITMDKNGDAEGNYSLIALVVNKTDSESKYFKKVGTFQSGEKQSMEEDLPNYVPSDENRKILWVGNEKPDDEPGCGFDGSRCIRGIDNKRKLVAVVLGSFLVIITIIAIILYKNWKYEQEIAGLLWKIDIKDLIFKSKPGVVTTTSKLSLVSQTSLESRLCYQTFAPTGTYRGVLVASKLLRFAKKNIEISRGSMKEMRAMREMHQDNVNPFLGACVDANCIYVVTEYCAKGSLSDVLENDDLKLDSMFIASLIFDLIKGMTYLHDSELKTHGNLKSSNCVVTSRWVLQITDFGLHELRRQAVREQAGEDQFYYNLLWKAPELLRDHSFHSKGTPKGDVYAFGIILHEIVVRNGPFGDTDKTSKEIIQRIKCPIDSHFLRPSTENIECQDYVVSCMKDCWHEKPDVRPDFRHIRDRLKKMRHGMKSNIFDNMMIMMEKYASNLEEIVEQRTALLMEEKKKTEALLHRMLPQSVAAQLMRGEAVEPESFEAVTIYFSDIVGFTEMSAQSTPLEVVAFLNELYTRFDAITRNYNVYKVETIGDAYMVVSGLPIRNKDFHAAEIASMALELLNSIKSFRVPHRPNDILKLRIGIHTGPVVAGVVGITMPRYCLFGDTVNTASRMESTGEPLKIHISQQCREHLEKLGGYQMVERGLMKIKGKGEMRTAWLLGDQSLDIQRRRANYKDLGPQPAHLSRNDIEARRRSPKMGAEARAASILGRRNSSIPRVMDFEAKDAPTGNGMMGMPSFLVGSTGSGSGNIDSPRHRRPRSPARGRSCSIDKQAQDSPGLSPRQSYETLNVAGEDLDSKCHEEPEGKGVVTNGCVVKNDNDKQKKDDIATPLLSANDRDCSVERPNFARIKLNHFLDRKTAKRWRSCDEIEKPARSSFRDWVTGLFSSQDGMSNNSPGVKGRNKLVITEQDTESMV